MDNRFVPPGHHRDVAAVRAHLQSIDASFDCDDAPLGRSGPLGAAATVFGREVDNRFAIHPMEGWDGGRDGLPSAHTLRRWRNFGRSGARLIWGGEAFAVTADGRANPNQLYLNPEAEVERGLGALVDAVRAGHRELGEDPDRLVLGLQLTHSGRFSRPDGPPAPKLAYHHPVLEAKYAVDPSTAVLTDGELDAIGERYVRAAELAANTGFAFVDVKCCHGYLLHELLGARSRDGSYGGDFDHRTAFFRRIVAGIRAASPQLAIGVRLSAVDTVPFEAGAGGQGRPMAHDPPWPYGFGIDQRDPRRTDPAEAIAFLRLLERLDLEVANITLGSPYYNPHLQRPATYPPSDGYEPPVDPLVGVFEHLRTTRRCKAEVPSLKLVGTGYSYLQEWLPHVAQHELRNGHVDFVGIGRMALVYPDLVRDVLDGRPLERKRVCRTFSDCTTAPRNGMVSGCYPLDPYYRELPEAKRLKQLKRGS